MPLISNGSTRDHIKQTKSERQTLYDITYMCSLKYDTNEPIYETETKSETQRIDWWLPRGSWGRQMDWEFGLADAY